MRPLAKRLARRAATAAGMHDVVRAYEQARQPWMRQRDRQDMQNLAVLLGFWLRPDASCIDIGAHSGDVLKELVDRAPEGRHLAFEPLPDMARGLRERFPQVEVHEVALADRTGTDTFTWVPEAPAYSGFRRQWYPEPMATSELTVQVARLDDVLPEDFAPRLVKIDVEGAEGQVLAGAAQTLARHRPIVVLEHFEGGASAYGLDSGAIHQALVVDAGLTLRDIDGHGPYDADELRAVVATRRMWTFVATPD